MNRETESPMRRIELDQLQGSDRHAAVLLETEAVKVLALQLVAGGESGLHTSSGEVLIECREGEVTVHQGRHVEQLRSGQAVHLPGGVEHFLRASESSPARVLLTKMAAQVSTPGRRNTAAARAGDEVEEASSESFPASDPPSFNPIVSP